MTLASAFIPFLGKRVKFGRVRSPALQPRLKLSSYLRKSLPNPPATMDYSPKAMQSISQVYLNDELRNCVIACIAHIAGILTGNATGNPLMFTQQQILALYSAIGGYVVNNPNTDNGCSIQDALNFWRAHGAPIGSHQIAGAISVNSQDPVEYRTAIWLFENLIFGVELPDAWIANPMPGFVWNPGPPNPKLGHCVGGLGYNSQGVQLTTWGMMGTITDNAMHYNISPQAGGELYAVISKDMIDQASQKAPNGFDWAGLVSDFNAMGGNLPTPPPAPLPPPPTPPIIPPIVPPVVPPITPPVVPPLPPLPPSSLQQLLKDLVAYLEFLMAQDQAK